VRGTKGEIFYDYTTLRWRTAESEWNDEQFPEGIDNRFVDEIQHFVNAVNGKCPLELDAATSGLKSLEVLESAYGDIRRA
jgi:predicted dehydrogenase